MWTPYVSKLFYVSLACFSFSTLFSMWLGNFYPVSNECAANNFYLCDEKRHAIWFTYMPTYKCCQGRLRRTEKNYCPFFTTKLKRRAIVCNVNFISPAQLQNSFGRKLIFIDQKINITYFSICHLLLKQGQDI